MTGDGGKPDWREGLKGLRARLPSAPPSSPAGTEAKTPGGAVAKRPAKPAAPAPTPPEPPPDPAAEAALFERELESQGVVASAGGSKLAQLPHAAGPAAGEARPPEPAAPAPAASRLQGDRRALSQKLDLHHYRLDDALAKVREVLAQHRDLGSNELLIVTGHAEARGHEAVLRPAVEALLAKHPGVARVEPDGAGAFRVTLRPRKP